MVDARRNHLMRPCDKPRSLLNSNEQAASFSKPQGNVHFPFQVDRRRRRIALCPSSNGEGAQIILIEGSHVSSPKWPPVTLRRDRIHRRDSVLIHFDFGFDVIECLGKIKGRESCRHPVKGSKIRCNRDCLSS